MRALLIVIALLLSSCASEATLLRLADQKTRVGVLEKKLAGAAGEERKAIEEELAREWKVYVEIVAQVQEERRDSALSIGATSARVASIPVGIWLPFLGRILASLAEGFEAARRRQ